MPSEAVRENRSFSDVHAADATVHEWNQGMEVGLACLSLVISGHLFSVHSLNFSSLKPGVFFD